MRGTASPQGKRPTDRVLIGFSVASLASMAVSAAQHAPVFKTTIDLVNIGVTVGDRKGALVPDLGAGDFEVWEDGKKQEIRYFSTGDAGAPGPPLHLGVLLDVSGSMVEDIGFTRTAAIKFLNTLPDAVDMTVVDFDTQVRVARYEQADFPRLVERIRQQKTSGWTALYDAIGVYLDGAGGQDGRKVMLLYTDGGDTRSAIRLHELVDLLKASDVTLYAVGALQHQSSSTRFQQIAVLRQIAETTGGQAFFPQSVKELDSAYGKVLEEIRGQYTVGYLSTNQKTDGGWRKIEIKIPGKGGYRLRARKGYFGPYRRQQ